MSLITKPKTLTNGTVANATDVESNFTTIYNDYNGSITNANISASAAIADTKLGQIATASKVSGTAITELASITSSAGIIPAINLASGDTGTTMYLRGDGSYQQLTDGGGLVRTDILASGNTSTSVYLRGDQTWYSPTGLGTWVDMTTDRTGKLAATDGFVVANFTGAAGRMDGKTDSNASPSTIRLSTNPTPGTDNQGFTMPVRKGDYWSISTSGTGVLTVYWISLGS